jgi:transcriptional regulator with XRE-family HTH domain
MKKTIYSREHKSLIARLKKAREAAGLQQQDVARLLRRTQSYVSKLESGQRRIDIIQLKTLARIYKKSLDHLLG